MTPDFYRFLGFLDVVTTMLEQKQLVTDDVKFDTEHAQKQLTKARKKILEAGLHLQAAKKRFTNETEVPVAAVGEALRHLQINLGDMDPGLAAQFVDFMNVTRSGLLGGGSDCSTSVQPPPPSSSSSSSSSSSKPKSSSSS